MASASEGAREALLDDVASTMSDDEEEVEEDARIAKLYSFAEKKCDDGLYDLKAGDEFAAKLDELGTADATVLGGMWAGPQTCALRISPSLH